MTRLPRKPSPGLRPPSPVPTGEGALEKFLPNPKLKLREQLGEVMRFKHFSHRTESAYWCWIRGFILFHQKRHPRAMGTPEVQAYLSHLATAKNVAPATQNQALNAIVFLYRDVLNVELGGIGKIERPTRRPKLPTVLTKEEMKRGGGRRFLKGQLRHYLLKHPLRSNRVTA